MIEGLEAAVLRAPLLRGLYRARAAQLKRMTCLTLDRLGVLWPITFVQWLVTYACNLRCPFCEASAGAPQPGELTPAEGEALIDDLARARVRRLLFSGGEPLMRPELPHLIRRAAARGLAPGLASNGTLVGERWGELRGLPYFLYFTSLDGPPEMHDHLRGREDAFARALDGLARFAAARVPVRIVNTVVQPDNLASLPALLELVRKAGATRWHLTPLVRVGRAAAAQTPGLDRAQLQGLLRFVREQRHRLPIRLGESHTYLWCLDGDPVGKPFFCGAGLTRASIMPDGEVLGCHQVYDVGLSEGNVRTRPFSQLWRQGFQRFRAAVPPQTCQGCAHWSACQGGCWAEQQTQGRCLRDSLGGGG